MKNTSSHKTSTLPAIGVRNAGVNCLPHAMPSRSQYISHAARYLIGQPESVTSVEFVMLVELDILMEAAWAMNSKEIMVLGWKSA